MEKIFNRGPVPVAGGMAQVVSSDWRPDKPFGAVNISSMRQIVDLANFSASQIVNTTGQSGHVGAAHYADMIKRWARVEYVPVYWNQEESPTARAGSVWKCGRAEDKFPEMPRSIKATEYRGRQWQRQTEEQRCETRARSRKAGGTIPPWTRLSWMMLRA